MIESLAEEFLQYGKDHPIDPAAPVYYYRSQTEFEIRRSEGMEIVEWLRQLCERSKPDLKVPLRGAMRIIATRYNTPEIMQLVEMNRKAGTPEKGLF